MAKRYVELSRRWELGEVIGGGGFAVVYSARDGDEVAALKLVPKVTGAGRDLLMADLEGIPNVVPVIDSGETTEHYALVMPLAAKSLRTRLEESDGRMTASDTVIVLEDVAAGLAALDGSVVHRDIKPENILLLSGRWCLADFGIARYAEATTAVDTHKYSMTPPYAAPEQWRNERATASTDVYGLGVVAYECLTGSPPFVGSEVSDLRDQHLHSTPAVLDGLPPGLASLISECLLKAPQARPSAANLLARLPQMRPASTAGLASLQQANNAEVARRADVDREQSAAQTAAERRAELVAAAKQTLERVRTDLGGALTAAAPAADLRTSPQEWTISLGSATLRIAGMSATRVGPWQGWDPPAFTVIAHTALSVSRPQDRSGYAGRSHSLWFCDAGIEGEFGWYETAFMTSPLLGGSASRRNQHNPYALEPGEESAKAVWNGMADYQVAWPFTRLDEPGIAEFIDRWAGWLAAASRGQMQHPSTMPERPTDGTWRRR